MMIGYLFFITLSCSVTSLVSSTRQQRAKERMYEQEKAVQAKAEEKESIRKQKLLRHAKRRIAKNERTKSIAAYSQSRAKKYVEELEGQYAHLYPAPAWSDSLRYSYAVHEGRVQFAHQRATKSFDRMGSVSDVSALQLTDKPQLQDILLPSKLLKQGVVTVQGEAEFLLDLAESPLRFCGEVTHNQLDLGYSCAFFNNSLMVGVQIPVVEKMHRIEFRMPLTDTIRKQLRGKAGDPDRNAEFRLFYGTSVSAFIDDVLIQKGVEFEAQRHQLSVGDTTFFLTGAIESRLVERCHLGFQLTLPYAHKPELEYFFAPQLGNGGFVEGLFQASVLMHRYKACHPHLQFSLSGGLPATVRRRVPKFITSVGANTDEVVMGDLVLGGTNYKTLQPDTLIPAFAQNTTDLTVQPGVMATARIGALFPECMWKDLQCDLSYEALLRTKDIVSGRVADDEWDVSWWRNAPYRYAHRIHVDFIYQPSDALQCEVGVNATCAGRDIEMSYGYRFAFRGRW